MTAIAGIPVVLEEGEEEISPWLYVGEIIVVVCGIYCGGIYYMPYGPGPDYGPGLLT